MSNVLQVSNISLTMDVFIPGMNFGLIRPMTFAPFFPSIPGSLVSSLFTDSFPQQFFSGSSIHVLS